MTGNASKKIWIAATLSLAAQGCSGSGSDGGGLPSAGAAGTVSVSGSGGSAGSAGTVGAGGTAGPGGPAGPGGAVSSAGAANLAGATTAGGSSGGMTAGGLGGAPNSAGNGASAGSGGVLAQGGNTGIAGQAGSGQGGNGAEAGNATGGSAQGGGASGAGGQSMGGRPIAFGTLLEAQAVITAAQQLAQSVAKPGSPQWRAKGDQHRSYRFAEANSDEPYRLYVPTTWDGESKLPLVMFLHGAGADENTYVDQNNKQLLELSEQHGYIFVAPLGRDGAYGNFLRLAAPFGKPQEAVQLMAQVTAESERTNALSERDVINVLELVLGEYPVERGSMFLTGHSMGSGGTWYIGGKYASYWRGIAPMSGPFVQESGYPWDALREMNIFVTEGTQTPSLEGSHALRDWLKTNGFKAEYEEVNADHGGMVRLVLPNVFEFFDRSRPQ